MPQSQIEVGRDETQLEGVVSRIRGNASRLSEVIDDAGSIADRIFGVQPSTVRSGGQGDNRKPESIAQVILVREIERTFDLLENEVERVKEQIARYKKL